MAEDLGAVSNVAPHAAVLTLQRLKVAALPWIVMRLAISQRNVSAGTMCLIQPDLYGSVHCWNLKSVYLWSEISSSKVSFMYSQLHDKVDAG